MGTPSRRNEPWFIQSSRSSGRRQCTPPGDLLIEKWPEETTAGLNAGRRRLRREPRRLECQRIGQAHPAPAFHHGQERRVGALMLVGAEAGLGAVEDVAIALDGLERLDEVFGG